MRPSNRFAQVIIAGDRPLVCCDTTSLDYELNRLLVQNGATSLIDRTPFLFARDDCPPGSRPPRADSASPTR
jgi:hypothetical protein